MNPNLDWFGMSADNLARMLAITLGGNLTSSYSTETSAETNETIDRVMKASNRDEATGFK
jgi:hypothetical protein